MSKHYNVIVVGGGTAGIMVSSQLKRKNSKVSIALFDPADKHYYQPAWTLVGADAYKFEDTERNEADLIPDGVDWKKEFVASFEPTKNSIKTKSGDEYTYDSLVVCPGIKIAPELVEGLAEAMDKGVVCSNYTDPKHTLKVLKNFKGGTALFTQPATPIKCGGAPQKIMYLADEFFEKAGIRSKTDIVFATPGSVIFGVKPIAKTLMEVIKRKDINLRFHHKLVKVDGVKQIAWYEITKDVKAGGCVVISGDNDDLDEAIQHNYKDVKVLKENGLFGIQFDMMHLAPPQQAPDFIRSSPLANADGWLDTNKHTLQHNKFENIFCLGDAAALPTAKTGAAIRKQAPLVVTNVLNSLESKGVSDEQYNGYSSCPLVTGYSKMVLAEFDYDKNFTPDPKLKQFPMLVSDSDKEHWRLFILKKYILPHLYWKKMMKGYEV